MKYCHSCGKEIKKRGKYCAFCGIKLKRIKFNFIIIFLIIIGLVGFGVYIAYINYLDYEENLENQQTAQVAKQKQQQVEEEFQKTQAQKKQELEQEQYRVSKQDNDGDGLTYEQELNLGTDDNNPDSDADGIKDGEDAHPAGGGKIHKITVHWEHDNLPYTTQFGIAEDWYLYYKNQPRGWCCEGWEKFAIPNDPTIQTIAKDIVDVSLSTGDTYRFGIAVDFVKSMVYQYDIDYNSNREWPKYAIETIIDERGDCEDTSFLMVSVLEALGIDCVLLNFPGHFASGVACSNCDGVYFNHHGKKYYYLETTGHPGSWKLGGTSWEYASTIEGIIDV